LNYGRGLAKVAYIHKHFVEGVYMPWTPLMQAVYREELEELKRLLSTKEQGGGVNTKDDQGNTALLLASAKYDNPLNDEHSQLLGNIMIDLVCAGADPSIKNNLGRSPLSFSYSNHTNMKRFLEGAILMQPPTVISNTTAASTNKKLKTILPSKL
jgi:ankyrin repeat protein